MSLWLPPASWKILHAASSFFTILLCLQNQNNFFWFLGGHCAAFVFTGVNSHPKQPPHPQIETPGNYSLPLRAEYNLAGLNCSYTKHLGCFVYTKPFLCDQVTPNTTVFSGQQLHRLKYGPVSLI